MAFERILMGTCAAIAGLALASGITQAAEPFYEGKRVTLVVGYSPGGGYDTYSRLLAEHMEKHLPGNPNIVVKNRTGAGSIVAANYIATNAPKDGTVFGTFTRSLPLFYLLKSEKVKVPFDPFKLTWLGSLSSYDDDAYMVLVSKKSPFKSLKDLRDPNMRPANFSTTAPGSTGHDVPFLLSHALDLRIKLITGYPGSKQGALALDRGEADGRSQGLSSIRATQSHWIKKDLVHFLVQFGRRTRHPDFPNVPTARELAPDDEALALIKLQETPLFMARPYAAPPGLPPERAKVLKAAFMATARDPEFASKGKKLGIDISPIDGDEVAAILDDLKKTPPSVLDEYKRLMASMPKLKMVEHTGKVSQVKREGRRIYIMHKGKEVRAKISGSRTDVTIDGKADKRKNVKVGMTCTFTYPGPGNEAKKVDCES